MKGFAVIILIASLSTGLGYAQDLKDHDEHGHQLEHGQMSDEPAGEPAENLGICPVMGGAASKEYSYTYEGKAYYFCCPSCIEEFKKDPQKYISKIKEFNLEAYQFSYEPQEIRVKQGDIVRILGTSRDVQHGVYIKEYNINVSLKKGETKKIEFIADKTGEFQILCSVYCGKGHHEMKAKLIVE